MEGIPREKKKKTLAAIIARKTKGPQTPRFMDQTIRAIVSPGKGDCKGNYRG